jgi:3-oxoacyl-[acyl-carrier protein] reductase
MRLTGRTALITGSSSGIGRATALHFAREGADIVVNGRNEERIAAVVAEVEKLGRRALGMRANIGSFAETGAMVSNAGVFHHTAFTEMAEAEWDEVLTVDLKGAFNCARAVIDHMVARRWGRIICVTAISGLHGIPNMAHICAAKTGVHGFVRALAAEFASAGITVNAVAPGLVETPILVNFTEEDLARFRRAVPLGRIGKPEEIAEACAYLASEAAAYTTGNVLNLSGGTLT